eukprot:gene19656-23276_t
MTGIGATFVPWQGVQTFSLKSNFSTYPVDRQRQQRHPRHKQNSFNVNERALRTHEGRERMKKTSLYDISELLDGVNTPDINLQKQLHFRLMSFEGFSKPLQNSKQVISVLEKLQK